MKLLTKAIERQLLKNWPDQEGLCQPALKLFNPCGAATWLITCMDPDYPDHLSGLCDLGFGFPEIGLVSLSEIQTVRGPLGLGIERDMYFTADFAILCRRRHKIGYVDLMVMQSSRSQSTVLPAYSVQ